MLSADAPPDFLSTSARQWWGPFVVDLQTRGSLPRVAAHRLGMYCELFAQWLEINAIITKASKEEEGAIRNGQIQQTYFADGQQKDRKVSAEADRQIQLAKEIRAYDREFGFLNSKEETTSKEGSEQTEQEADAKTLESLEVLKARLLAGRA